eukprot:1220838-Prymnesium_polylepis.1
MGKGVRADAGRGQRRRERASISSILQSDNQPSANRPIPQTGIRQSPQRLGARLDLEHLVAVVLRQRDGVREPHRDLAG